MKDVLNVAAYKFAELDDASHLCPSIRAEAQTRGLKGTVLLASEGINLVLAGDPQALRDYIAWLRIDDRLTDLIARESWSPFVPFARLRVTFKREIIRMDRPAVRPADQRAPAVGAAALARWLDTGHDDEGRPVVMLDTRNAFEVAHGAFDGALDWRLARFGDFPAALAAHGAELRGKTVVTYCTGGIRCEKTSAWMRDMELPVYQLEGGILNYFQQVPDAHLDWRGECFVFDNRVSLDTRLQETSTTLDDVYGAEADGAWRLARARRLALAGRPAAEKSVP